MATNTFGVYTDYFGIADTDWELQSSSDTPESSQAQASDEVGDVDCEERYENTSAVECVYKLKSTAASVGLPTTFKGGNTNDVDGETYVITGGTLETSNTERPTLTVTGEKMHGDTATLQVYDFAAEVSALPGKKKAHPVGFETGGETKVNSCTVNFSTETSRLLDSYGEIEIIDTYAGRVESSGDLVTCSGNQSASALTGWSLQQNPSESEENTNYLTGSIAVYKNLSKTA